MPACAGHTVEDDRSHTMTPRVYPEPATPWAYSTVWDGSANSLTLRFTFHDPGAYSITVKMAYEDFPAMDFTVVPGSLSLAATTPAGAGTRFGEENAWNALRVVPRDGSAAANALPPGRLDAAKFSLLSSPAVAATTAGGSVVGFCTPC